MCLPSLAKRVTHAGGIVTEGAHTGAPLLPEVLPGPAAV